MNMWGAIMTEKKSDKKEADVLITFLKRTKNGEYAPVSTSSLLYARTKFETIMLDEDEGNFIYTTC